MPALATTSALLSSSILQYRPGVDTDYRKPECVGCNKAFARRDTVILHIKNIRRKWELHWSSQKMATGITADVSQEQGVKQDMEEEEDHDDCEDGEDEDEDEDSEMEPVKPNISRPLASVSQAL
ncbi:hypothetical protein BGZ73_003225 [Actinomortierella ambigua]|nr:hypothetical protein BGZ73_003225 [Actinomortierella ambigua]